MTNDKVETLEEVKKPVINVSDKTKKVLIGVGIAALLAVGYVVGNRNKSCGLYDEGEYHSYESDESEV